MGSETEVVKISDHNVNNKDKKEVPSNLQKICLVCGDKALGYNFNAISCESCKAFFRRNALSSKELKCPFTNNCDITVVTRRFCQKCRLEKCLSIGMVKEFIMSEEDKAEKRKKIQENRAKKRQLHDSPDETVSSSKNSKREDENTSGSIQFNTENSGIQYDVLNSTTCSPSNIESTMNSDIDQSSMSSYSQFPSDYQHYNNQNYQHRKYLEVHPMDEKGVYSQRIVNDYSMSADSMTAFYDCSTQKSSNSIRYVYTLW